MEKVLSKKKTTAKQSKQTKVASIALDALVYDATGQEKETIKLPESLFGLSWNDDLVHQVVVSMQSNARLPIAHAKTRAEVRGGGTKPWRQKGTGRARHGSIRSPIWVGGGVTHGPRNDKNYSKKINKKVKSKALAIVLSRKYKDGEILFVNNISVAESKTKEAVSFLKNLEKIAGFKGLISKKKNASYLVVPEKDSSFTKSFSNIGNVTLNEVRNLNPLDLLNNKFLIIVDPKKSISILEERLLFKPKRKIEEGIKTEAQETTKIESTK